jgi:flagellar FliL protein
MPPQNDKPGAEGLAAPDKETKEKSKKKIPPIAIYLLAGIILLGGGYFVGSSFFGSSKETGENQAAESKEAKSDPKKGKTAGKEEKKSKHEGPSTVVMMEDIIVNPSGTSGTRFLSVSIGFEVGSAETQKLFEERQPLIKDALLTILGSKTMEQLSDPKQKEITRFQIKKRVEQLLDVDDLAAVYFTDFILQ